MSYRLVDWALDVEGITPTQKLVLAILARCCNGNNGSSTCWPSVAHLAAKSGYSDRAIQQALLALEARNLIERRNGGGKATTVYRLAGRDSPNRCLDLEGLSTPERGSGVPPNDVRPTPERGSGVPPNDVRSPPNVVRGEKGRNRISPLGEEREGATIPSTTLKTLSQAPLGDWLAIAREVRPDLRDPAGCWTKFQGFYQGAEHAPDEWQKLWHLWLLREREKRARCYTQSTVGTSRTLGAFLSAPAPDDLTAAYEITAP